MYLFVFYCIFLVALFVIPSYLTYKRTGINPFKFSEEETAINYLGRHISYFSHRINYHCNKAFMHH
jgi:hypothetical protein